MPSFYPSPMVTLEGLMVRLVPMEMSHAPRLFEIAGGTDLWEWFPESIKSSADMTNVVGAALRARELGTALPFVIVDRATNEIAGSTRFFAPVPKDRRTELGWTWIGPKWQRSGINLESKYLMLTYAFEVLNCNRVELKTDSRNMKSQRAMTNLGLTREGVLRSHMITHSGHSRDSVYFSAIQSEWPDFKLALQKKIQGNSSNLEP